MVPLADFSREIVNLEVKYVGRVGRPFACLNNKVVWGSRTLRLLTSHFWLSSVGSNTATLTTCGLVCLKPVFPHIVTYSMLHRGLVILELGPVFWREGKSYKNALCGKLEMEKALVFGTKTGWWVMLPFTPRLHILLSGPFKLWLDQWLIGIRRRGARSHFTSYYSKDDGVYSGCIILRELIA